MTLGVAVAIPVLCAFAILFYRALGFYVGGRRFKNAAAFRAELERLTGLEGTGGDGWFERLEHVRFFGALPSGRLAWIAYQGDHHETGRSRSWKVELSVAADSAVRLAVKRTNLLVRLGNWLGLDTGLKVGDQAFDRQFWMESSSPERAKNAMTRGLKALVQELFTAYRVDTFEVHNGLLRVELRERFLAPDRYAGFLAKLDVAAATFDRVKLAVKVLGGERSALRDGRGGTRCAYCHGPIDGSETNLVACDRCHTVLHDDCWHELGRCPLLGCTGRDPERARA